MLNTALILSAIVLIFASVFRSTIKLCKKDEYKIESIKYVSFKSYKLATTEHTYMLYKRVPDAAEYN